MSNYYDILGVDKSAGDADIKKAYRKLAMKYHPDRNQGNPQAEEEFKKVNEAYAVLSDKQKRQQYDMFGDQKFHQQYSSEDIFRGTDFGSIFDEFGMGNSFFSSIFGGAGGFQGQQGFRRGPRKGQDVEYPLTIGFMDAYNGSERSISYSLSDGTRRSLTVRIPKGVQQGAKLRVAGRGAPSPDGGSAGDLYVLLDIASHPDFTRQGMDIETKLKLKVSEAFLGCSKSVNTPEGEKKLKVPKGVRPGTKIRLKGLGFKDRATTGDLYCSIELEIPNALSPEQMDAIVSLQESGL